MVDENGKANVTDRAIAAGWVLPDGFTVHAWVIPQSRLGRFSDPRHTGSVYNTDAEEDDYRHPTRAFCAYCDAWIHQLDQAGADQVNQLHPADEDGQPIAVAGDWITGKAGIACLEADTHTPAEPLVIREWRAGRWSFVTVHVVVADPDGEEWGHVSLGTVEAGLYPRSVDRDTGAVETIWVDPIAEDYPASDLINEALAEAARQLAAHDPHAPAITRT